VINDIIGAMALEQGPPELTRKEVDIIENSTRAYATSLEKLFAYILFFRNTAGRLLSRRVLDNVEEHSMSFLFRFVDTKLDRGLFLFVNSRTEADSNKGVIFARAVCAHTADRLVAQKDHVQTPQILQALDLAARRSILLGAKTTKEVGGVEVDPDWLNNFIQQITNPWVNPESVNSLKQKFIDSPPTLTL